MKKFSVQRITQHQPEVKLPHGATIAEFYSDLDRLYIGFSFDDEPDGGGCCDGVPTYDIIKVKMSKSTEVDMGEKFEYVASAVVAGRHGQERWFLFADYGHR